MYHVEGDVNNGVLLDRAMFRKEHRMKIRIVMFAAVVTVVALVSSQKAVSQEVHAALSQQKQCAEQAKRSFAEDFSPTTRDADGFSYDYTSHFDPKRNVCYILLSAVGTPKGGPVVIANVYDAYEHTEYASYFWMNVEGKKYRKVEPVLCRVKPPHADEIFCKSPAQFDTLILKHFGVRK